MSTEDVLRDFAALADAKDAELARLRAFARRIMQAWPDGDVDGLELQEAAVEAGILRETRPREACGESCRCADYYGDRNFRDGHVVCYRVVKEALGDGHD
jgi:hypothetical protein